MVNHMQLARRYFFQKYFVGSQTHRKIGKDPKDHPDHPCHGLGWSFLACLCRSLWMASLPSVTSIASLSLVSSANLVKVHSIPLSRSLIKMLKTKVDPCGTSLITRLCRAIEPLTTTLWLRSPLSTEYSVQPSNP